MIRYRHTPYDTTRPGDYEMTLGKVTCRYHVLYRTYGNIMPFGFHMNTQTVFIIPDMCAKFREPAAFLV